MNTRTLHIAAIALIAAGFGLLLWGLQAARWAWLLGLGFMGAAMLVAIAMQWARPEAEAEERPEEKEAGQEVSQEAGHREKREMRRRKAAGRGGGAES
jgi:polyferredoxin